jgi:hypothetical protein
VVEQRPFKPKVVGSIPTAPTNPSSNKAAYGRAQQQDRLNTNLRTPEAAKVVILAGHSDKSATKIHRMQFVARNDEEACFCS